MYRMKLGNLLLISLLLLLLEMHTAAGCPPADCPRIAILCSDYTKRWFIEGPAYHPGEPWGESEFNMYWGGWKNFLDSKGIKYAIIGDPDVENLKILFRYKLIILPNVAAMSKKEVKNIEAFVALGGSVIATFGTSWLDENGKIVDGGNFALWKLWGIKLAKEFGMFVKSIYISKSSPVTKGIKVGSFVDYGANANILKPDERSARYVTALLVDSSGKITDYPAIVEREFCHGRVVYFSFSPEYVYSLGWANKDMKLLMANAVQYALGR